LGRRSTRFLWLEKRVRVGASVEGRTQEVERKDVLRSGVGTGEEKPRLVEKAWVVAIFERRVG
jgi:plasmid stability protein